MWVHSEIAASLVHGLLRCDWRGLDPQELRGPYGQSPRPAAAKTTRARLEAAGFGEVNTWLHEEPTELDSMDELARFLKTVVLGHHIERLPESEREEHFAAMVAARLVQRGDLVVDYVRLNILAKREVAA